MTFLDFHVECGGYAELYILDSNGNYIMFPTCGSGIPGPVTESSGYMVVYFRTEDFAATSYRGFIARFEAVTGMYTFYT